VHLAGTTATNGLLVTPGRAQGTLPGYAVGKMAVLGAAGVMAGSMAAAARAQEAAADAATNSSGAPVEVALQGSPGAGGRRRVSRMPMAIRQSCC
jgi:hypothetical protein